MSLFSGLTRYVGRLKRHSSGSQRPFEIPFDEHTVIYAVGDVHGSLTLLKQLEAMIKDDFDAIGGQGIIVMLGDFVDRGPDSAGVLDHLVFEDVPPFTRICLAGNHEASMLSFLRKPNRNHEWLRFGGMDTLMSYGLDLNHPATYTVAGQKLDRLLHSHIPREHIDFLERLHYLAVTEAHVFVHAAVDPARPLSAQKEETLLWAASGIQDYGDYRRIVVHGHTQVEFAAKFQGRIAVDTGAYATGRLSAVRLRKGLEPSFLATN